MDQPSVSATEANQNNNFLAAKKHIVVSTILLAIFLPPIGILMSIWLAIKSGKILRYLWLIAVCILLAVISASFYYRLYLNNNKPYDNYAYQNEANTKLTETKIGTISFQRPVEFTESQKREENNTTTHIYNHLSDKGYALGYVAASAAKSDLATDKKYIEGITNLMKEGKGEGYDKYTETFRQFIKSFNHPDYSVVLSSPKEFKNTAIKDKAWIFETKLQTTNTDIKYAPLQGQFIFAAGEKSFYYFTALTLDNNWEPSAKTWQQVTNSIKINQ